MRNELKLIENLLKHRLLFSLLYNDSRWGLDARLFNRSNDLVDILYINTSKKNFTRRPYI